MPLKMGLSKKTVEANIHELVSSGYNAKQAVAIALHKADEERKKKQESK